MRSRSVLTFAGDRDGSSPSSASAQNQTPGGWNYRKTQEVFRCDTGAEVILQNFIS